jgi:hypothetical protein
VSVIKIVLHIESKPLTLRLAEVKTFEHEDCREKEISDHRVSMKAALRVLLLLSIFSTVRLMMLDGLLLLLPSGKV